MFRHTLSVTRWFWLFLLAAQVLGRPISAQNQETCAPPASCAAASTPSATPDYDAILAAEGYLKPPAEIERAVLAPRHLLVNLTNVSPNGSQFLKLRSPGQPKVADLGKPHHNLAGWFVYPAGNRSRAVETRFDVGIELLNSADGKSVSVQLPQGATVTSARWSPKGDQVAYFVNTPTETQIWVADAATGRGRQVTRTALLATNITSFEWLADGQRIVALLLPANRGPEPANGLPSTPKVRVAEEGENRLRTYNTLLETPRDFALVEYYTRGQLAVINVRDRTVKNVGEPALIRSMTASPDGKFFRVTLLEHPFSYLVPIGNFPSRDVVWDDTGKELTELSRQALREGLPNNDDDDDDQIERRSLGWRPDGGGMVYFQRDPAPAAQGGGRGQGGQAGGAQGGRAQNQGQGQNQSAPQTPRMDRVVHWQPPFTAESTETVYTTEGEISAVRYSNDGQVLFITETLNNRQQTFARLRSDPNSRFVITDAAAGGGGRGGGGGGGGGRGGGGGGAQGTLLMKPGSNGPQVVRMSPDGQSVFLSGTARAAQETDDPDNAEQTGPGRPFIDKVIFRTGARSRIFEGNASFTETVAAVLDDDVTQIVLQRQTKTMVPQSFYKNITTGAERQLTQNQDVTPDELKNVQRAVFEAKRADGLDVRVRVTLPPNYREGDKLPAIFWFYPREYESFGDYYETSRGANGQPTGGPEEGPGSYPTFAPGSIQLFTLLGYAVVEPDSPIVGPEGRMNDNYVHDLRNNLSAIIDELDKRGIADRTRLAIGGHSYGGFSTMNAMVHTPYFKAGISGAGNSNRLLTPLGFQTERRDLWSAKDTYLDMSALLNANNLTGALLLYHGLEDQNVGTNPINSERMFHALNGLGKTSSLYMYPFEEHGQVGEETRLDMWARWAAWLDKYVKGLPKKPAATTQN